MLGSHGGQDGLKKKTRLVKKMFLTEKNSFFCSLDVEIGGNHNRARCIKRIGQESNHSKNVTSGIEESLPIESVVGSDPLEIDPLPFRFSLEKKERKSNSGFAFKVVFQTSAAPLICMLDQFAWAR